ncbi:glycosyltransferase [Algirhabdus cladophorae]|uniref:glycosyltransferase n=1 Tax=Algirhabdus cladophorae TaxID=3377108 RepID=UPI003B849EC7
MVHVVIQTRFSFFGKSGWRTADTMTPEILFEPRRLDSRLDLFEKIALASLATQEDRDFHLAVLSSRQMPKPYQTRLRELCHDTLGEDRASVVFRAPGHAPSFLRRFVHDNYDPTEPMAQVALDDDDGLAKDFVATAKIETEAALKLLYDDDEAVYLSFARGLSLIIGQDAPQIAPRLAPFNNQGLILAAPAGTMKNPYNTSHKMIPKRRPSRSIATKRPFYIRAVHDSNDSKALVEKDRLTAEEIAAMAQYFPFLPDLMQQNIRLNAA